MSAADEAAVRVRIRRLEHAAGIELPAYASKAAAGMDLRAALDEPVTLAPGAIARIPTGFAFEVPDGFEIQVRPRSGLAARHGVTVVNSPGTVDADYRGEVAVVLVNHGSEPFVVERGMRIAQVVLARAPRIEWVEAASLSATARGGGGFGHTGSA